MERVLVVARQPFEAKLSGQVFCREGTEEICQWIRAHFFFEERETAEYDSTVKQIIPYVILQRSNQFFLLRRLKGQTESRLHNRLSLGVGGHINPSEETAEDPLLAGLLRELAEEVSIETVRSLSCVGILNETTGGVSDYHTGIVYLMEVAGTVSVREPEKMSGTWATLSELQIQLDLMETWSQIVFHHVLL